MPRLLILIILVLTSAALRADILVIANAQNPETSLSKKQVVDLFMGRVSAFPSGQAAITLDYKAGTPLRSEFYKILTGKNEAQVDAYWATLVFAGRMTPPQQLADSSATINEVSQNRAAIAYIERQPLPTRVKVLLELPRSQ
jgi:ABC-type phosphate transport system substrate-binding protein